jgi:hypothetical protein
VARGMISLSSFSNRSSLMLVLALLLPLTQHTPHALV